MHWGKSLPHFVCVCVEFSGRRTATREKQRCRCGGAAVATTIALDIDMRQISQQLNCAYAASTGRSLTNFNSLALKLWRQQRRRRLFPFPVAGLGLCLGNEACRLPGCFILFLLRVAPQATWHWNVRPSHNYFCFLPHTQPEHEHIVQLLKCLPDGVVTSTATIETAATTTTRRQCSPFNVRPRHLHAFHFSTQTTQWMPEWPPPQDCPSPTSLPSLASCVRHGVYSLPYL